MLRGGEFFIGQESYFLLRTAENPIPIDNFSYGGRFLVLPLGTSLILSLASLSFVSWIPLALGFLSFILLWRILSRLNVPEDIRRLALGITLASPPFIYLFTTINHYFIAVFLALLGFYAFISNNKVLGALPFVIMPLFNLPLAVMSIILLFIYSFFLKKQDQFWLIFVCTSIVATSYYLLLAKYAGQPEKILFPIIDLGIGSELQHRFADLGGKFGLSIFGTMLAMLGVSYGWKKKYSDMALFFSLFILIILLFFTKNAIFFANFFIAILAAYALIEIFERGWESRKLKKFTILIILCGLVFSSIAFLDSHIESEPSKEIFDALTFFKELPSGVAFSHYTRGYWLEYSGKKTVMDSNFAFAPNVNERWQDSETLLNTRNLEEAEEIIEKYDINYIWIDQELADHYWEHDEQGLQFLLKYSEKFKKAYVTDEVKIWKVV